MNVLARPAPGELVVWPAAAVLAGLTCGALVALAGPFALFVLVGLVLAAALGALAWTRPVDTAILGIAATPLGVFTQSVGGAFNLSVSKMLFFAAACGWIGNKIVRRQSLLPRTPVTAGLVLLVLALVPGLVLGATESGAIKQIVLWASFAAIALAIAETGDARTVHKLLLALAIAGAGSAIAAIATGGGTSGQEVGEGGNYVTDRISGPFGQTNTLATYLAMCLPVQIVLATLHRGWLRWALLAGAGTCMLAMLLTLSRGGFIGLAVAGVLLIGYRPTRRVLLAAIGILAVSLAVAPGPVGGALHLSTLGARIGTIADPQGESATLRTAMYRAAPHMIADSPLFGFGAQSFPHVSARYGLVGASFNDEFGNPHNIYLGFVLDLGLVGLGAVALLGALAAANLRRAQRDVDPEKRAFALAIAAVLLGVAVIGVFHDFLPGDAVSGPLIILTGAAGALGTACMRQTEES